MRLVAVTFDAHDPARLATFWGGVLGRAVTVEVGGTKVAWGGPPVAQKTSRNRQRFDLAATDLGAAVAALVAVGATRLGDRDGGAELADPDGNEFWVSAG